MTFSFRVEQLGEARIVLQKRKVLVVASVVTVLGTQLDGDPQILHGRICFTGQAIESCHRVDDVIGLGRSFARAIEVFASLIPTSQVHQRDALRIVVFRRLQNKSGRVRDSLLADAQMHPGAVAKFLTWTFQDTLERLPGTKEFLLLETLERLFVRLQLLFTRWRVWIDDRRLGRCGYA